MYAGEFSVACGVLGKEPNQAVPDHSFTRLFTLRRREQRSSHEEVAIGSGMRLWPLPTQHIEGRPQPVDYACSLSYGD